MQHRGFTNSALLLGCAALLIACTEARKPTGVRPRNTVGSATSSVVAERPRPPAPPPAPPPPEPLAVSELPSDDRPDNAPDAGQAKLPSKLIIDQPQEIGPAGQMVASDRGVLMINRSDEVQLAKRGPLPTSQHPETARFTSIRGGSNDFFAVARGPLLLRGHVYWVRDGKLVRRPIDNSSPVQVLTHDARNGTRVVGADLADAPAHAAYISNPSNEDAPPRAKLWLEGAETLTLSPEGAGASSIALANTGEDLFAVAIDARSAMTPMHGRRISFPHGKAQLDPDVVMWVGSTSQPLSEVFASTTPLGVRAFLPIERDVSHFGLVMLELGRAPQMDPRTIWRGYPNGIDVAPVASAAFCGAGFVAYVRPETASPEARQVLEIAEITERGLAPPEFVASALGFANLSLASATNGAVLAYVADFRTFATTLRCTRNR